MTTEDLEVIQHLEHKLNKYENHAKTLPNEGLRKIYSNEALWLNEITKQLLINELADVEIMLQQLKLAIGYEKVNQEIDFKLNRQLGEIDFK